jgi:hypothetical protein
MYKKFEILHELFKECIDEIQQCKDYHTAINIFESYGNLIKNNGGRIIWEKNQAGEEIFSLEENSNGL